MVAKELPARPSLEQYRKQSKDLLKLLRSGDREALQRIERHRPRRSEPSDKFVLADAQWIIAREHGFESWPKLKKHIESLQGVVPAAEIWRSAERAVVAADDSALAKLRELPASMRDLTVAGV